MSFYNSLNQLWIKIQQKNIVLVSGNIDEIIPVDSELFKNILSKKEININGFTNILKFLELKTDEIDNKDFISYYSPNTGNIVNGKLKDNENNSNNDEFSSFNDENSSTGLISLKEYLNWMNSEIKNLKNDKTKSKSKYFVINFADIFMNDRVSDLSTTEFSQILESLIDQINTNASKFKNDNIKLIIISHNPNIVSTFITNNTEFASVTILKPDKNEREDFLKRYSTRFQNLKNTLNNIDHPDFKEAIAISNGLSFREIFQLSKLDTSSFANKELSFAELYKLATFFKKDSEWEKIDPSKLKDIETILRKRVKGQENAIQKVKNTLIRSFVGMNGILHSIDNSKPKGTLFFAGPTGTGKTELSKSIAEFIFGDEKRIIRFDMSEFNHEHSDQRLIGAPPGYVGYDAGGELTNKVKENPFSVLLFDEIEKAHNKILDKFLQILEDGRLTSSQGEIIDFSQTFIIFTSNIGANKANVNSSFDDLEKYFVNEVKKYFYEELQRPEILNRISEKNIVAFNFITDFNIIKEIVESKLNKIIKNLLEEKNISLTYNENFINDISEIIQNNYNHKNGGRGILNELENRIIDKLSSFIFSNYSQWQELKSKNEILKIDMRISGDNVDFESR